MRKSATNDDVLSTREAAERLGVALRTVQLWVEGGVLPAWKTAGGHRRISRVAVERLIEERRSALSGDGPQPPEPSEPGRLYVLLVEDEPAQRQLLIMMMESWGLPLSIGTAANGFEALLRIGQQCPDLLLTDLNMPGMDGFRMVSALRASGKDFAVMQIVVLTAVAAEEIATRGGLPDGVRVFYKPLDFDELETLVREQAATLLDGAFKGQPSGKRAAAQGAINSRIGKPKAGPNGGVPNAPGRGDVESAG